MTTPDNVLRLASIFVGLEETPGGPSPFGHWYAEQEDPAFRIASWCAMFVSFCTYNTGMPLPITTAKGYAYCPYGVEYFRNKKQWYTANPQPGDIVFYNFSGEEPDHTGIVKSFNQNSITTIEGDTSDANQTSGGAVQQKERDFPSQTIVGFGRPVYDGNDIGAIAKGVPPVPDKLITVSNTPFSSPDVLVWKQQMQHRGWAVAEANNSTFTAQDRDLLLNFQTLWNLERDGKLGSMSWVLTWLMPIKTENLEKGDYGDGVYRVQEALKKAGFNITVDGDFGSDTEAIVRQFQAQKHLTVDGQVGKETQAILLG